MKTKIGATVAMIALAGGGLAAAAEAQSAGTVLGGRTSQRWPIVIELNKSGRQIVAIDTALELKCTGGGTVRLPDGYTKVAVSGSGSFAASFGPFTQRNANGTTTDFEGQISGKLNKARTKGSGKWQFKGTDHDGTGAVTDTCESGSVSWKVKN